MAEETVSESRQREGVAIVVTKIDRRLMVYRDGDLVKTYPVAIGRLGSSLKRYAGDRATPEGKYSIVEKRSNSTYYKALLINYPNEEDLRKFRAARERGGIPDSVRIGGSVEIHGGGKDGMTYGCIALDNSHMEELFDMVEVGTRVTIVGSTDYQNSLSSASGGL
jgi:murein L,D-transpeptidase YafK